MYKGLLLNHPNTVRHDVVQMRYFEHYLKYAVKEVSDINQDLFRIILIETFPK